MALPGFVCSAKMHLLLRGSQLNYEIAVVVATNDRTPNQLLGLHTSVVDGIVDVVALFRLPRVVGSGVPGISRIYVSGI